MAIDVALRALEQEGPKLEQYEFKPLGAKLGGLWQINLRIIKSKRQIRILYAPYYGVAVVVFHIHKKSSKQEQKRAYELAMKRKKQAEAIMRSAGDTHVTLPTTLN